MRERLSIFFFLLCTASSVAQQTGRYSHEFLEPMIYNPAFTGLGGGTTATLISRAQWIDFRNAPQQNVFLLDGMLPNEKMGIGVSLFAERKGISRKTGGNLYYNYYLKLGEKAFLSLGLSAGGIDHTLLYSSVPVEDPTDPMLAGNSQRETSIDANAGLRLQVKGFQLGLAAPQLLGGTAEFQDNVSGKAFYSLSRHYLSTMSYTFLFSEDKFSFTPMAMIHYHPTAPFYYEGNLNFEWKDKFWIGATYKAEHAVSANAGFCIAKKLRLGYSYDFMIGKIAGYGGMSHEIYLGFTFGKGEKKETPQEVAVLPDKNKEKIDSMMNELQIKEDAINREENRVAERDRQIAALKKENEALKSAPVTPNPVTPNPVTPPTPTNTVAPAVNDYTILGTSKLAEKGYYVIVGTFLLRDLAEEELKRVGSGGSGAKILFSSSKQFHYVVASWHPTKEAAVKAVQDLKASGRQDVWILSIQN